MTDQSASDVQFSKEELLQRIHRAFTELDLFIQGLSPEQLSQPGSDGWAVKDHLTHLAIWELGVAELLQRRDRYAAMGLQEALDQGLDEDAENDVIYRRYAGLSPDEAKQMFYEAHNRMLEALKPLDTADLELPYTAYLPPNTAGPDRPIWHWVVSDTYGHFDEHLVWIKKLVAESTS